MAPPINLQSRSTSGLAATPKCHPHERCACTPHSIRSQSDTRHVRVSGKASCGDNDGPGWTHIPPSSPSQPQSRSSLALQVDPQLTLHQTSSAHASYPSHALWLPGEAHGVGWHLVRSHTLPASPPSARPGDHPCSHNDQDGHQNRSPSIVHLDL